MSDTTDKRDYSWFGMLAILLLIGWRIVDLLPFNIYINVLIAIVAVALLIAIFIAGVFGFIYMVSLGLGLRGQAIQDSWDYFEKMKSLKYEELSEEEKDKLIIACRVINGDCGIIMSDDEIIEALKSQLPIMTPKVGLSYPPCRE